MQNLHIRSFKDFIYFVISYKLDILSKKKQGANEHVSYATICVYHMLPFVFLKGDIDTPFHVHRIPLEE